MRLNFTLILLVLVSFTGTRAQMPIWVIEDTLQFGNSTMPAISVTIPEVEYEKTLKQWIKEIETGTRSKAVTESSGLSLFGARIKEISPDPLNVYSNLLIEDSLLKLIVTFELRKDQYIERSSSEADLAKAGDYLKEFAKNQYIDIIKDQVNTEEKKLREIERELTSLENGKSRMLKTIESAKSTIKTEQENLVVQNNELSTVATALDEQNMALTTMEEGPAKEEKMEYINELEKRKKKALSSIESSENKINKADDDIRKSEGDIPGNERDQEKVKEQFAAQDAVVQTFNDKLNTVKNY